MRTFDGKPWRGIADVVCGGFPCQDISASGKGVGIDGQRSGLWGEMARVIGEVRPKYAFIENSPMLVVRGLNRVLCDLASLGYDARWGIIGADAVGLPHHRSRLWLVANANKFKCDKPQSRQSKVRLSFRFLPQSLGEWIPEPAILGEHHGVDNIVDRCKAIGNGQVPAVAATAWRLLGGE